MNAPALPARERQALAAVAVQFFANGAMTASFAARAPQLRDNIGVELGEYGLLLTAAAVVGIFASLVAGRVVHAVTTKRVLAVGAVVMTLSLPVIGLARGPAVWMLGMAAYVLLDTWVDISMNLQGARLSAMRVTPIMNRLHGLWSMGTLAGGLGAVAANAGGWPPSQHLSSVAAVMAIVLAFTTPRLLSEDGVAGAEKTSAEKTSAEKESAEEAPGADRPAPRTSSLLPVVLIVLSGMFAVVMEALGGDWATFRLADDLGASAAVASAALACYSLGMMAMRLFGDHLQVRLGRLTLHRICVALATAGFLLASLVPLEWVSLLGFALVGIGVATFMPKLYDDAARLPGRRGAGLGAMSAGMRVAHVLTPALVGTLAGAGLSLGHLIAAGSLLAALGLTLVSEWSAGLTGHRT